MIWFYGISTIVGYLMPNRVCVCVCEIPELISPPPQLNGFTYF